MKGIKLFLLLPFMVCLSKTTLATCNPNAYLGSVCWMAGNFCPREYAEANGALLAISTNNSLFSLLGTIYGGDGRTMFGLPDLRGRVAIGEGTGPGLAPRVIGQRVGTEFHTIYPNQVPGNHQVTLSNLTYKGTVTGVVETGDTNDPTGNYPAQSAKGKLYEVSADAMLNTSSAAMVNPANTVLTTNMAGDLARSQVFLREPQLGLTPCIKIVGPYPPRS
ncbi:MAG: tail fiber protein [Cellvibrionales bacterium]|nr:tail fiber protein [Cellvibrionales bacterium]